MLLGCIGDDFTGSSDLANTLAKQGMRSVQYSGIPKEDADKAVQAGVVALKSRSIAPEEAVAQSLAALEWLKRQGCRQFFFKYCSTFDSTRDGNIGPVADALAEALDASPVIVCPAFPGTGRSLYQGHLFVKDALLSESGMQHHPLTPMTDPDIRRWLGYQSKYKIGHVPSQTVLQGESSILDALTAETVKGHRHIVVDAIQDSDLHHIGKAARDLPLITGGSGVALGLPANFGCTQGPVAWQAQPGPSIALSGSCSEATRAQVAHHKASYPSREIGVEEVITGTLTANVCAEWLVEQENLPLLYSSADPAKVAAVQETFGRSRASEALEAFFAEVARACAQRGVTKIITAGGETSGAIVEGLSIDRLEIGPEIDPGVPALRAAPSLTLALKSGNFGAIDFFEKAEKVLTG